MRRTERGVFSREERRIALWAMLLAVAVAAVAMLVQQPSLGPWGADQAGVSMPGVLEAEPVATG